MFSEVFKGKKVFITGHTGFKGAWLSLWLLKLGAEVIGYSKDIPTNPSLFNSLNIQNEIKHIVGDVRDIIKFENAILDSRPDFIFHLAAQSLVKTSTEEPLETVMTNTMGTAHLLEIIRKNCLESICILVTSDKCYENQEWIWGYKESDTLGGKDIYSSSKGAAEILFSSYFRTFFSSSESKVKVASVRAGNVIGGGDWAENRIIPDAIKAWTNSKSVEIRSPRATRPWQLVLEPLSGYLWLAAQLFDRKELRGESFNFGPTSSKSISVIMLMKRLAEKFSNIGNQIECAEQDTVQIECNLLKLNCDKAHEILEWESTLNFTQTIDMVASWYLKFHDSPSSLRKFSSDQIDEYCSLAQSKALRWALS